MQKFIGVDLGGTNIRAAIVLADGSIQCMKKSESHPERGAEAVMGKLINLLLKALTAMRTVWASDLASPVRSIRKSGRSSFPPIFRS